MRTIYYEQLRRHLEPENISIQSRTKSIAANSQHSSSLYGTNSGKIKTNHIRNPSFGSFEATTLT